MTITEARSHIHDLAVLRRRPSSDGVPVIIQRVLDHNRVWVRLVGYASETDAAPEQLTLINPPPGWRMR